MVVFDARSETDPFAGVHHWIRALRQAQYIQGAAALPLIKFLVAARIDRAAIGVSTERINSLMQELGFDGYFETSAKEGRQITELRQAILNAIQWDRLPSISSSSLFQHIKDFLISEKEAGHLLSTTNDLYHLFLKSNHELIGRENLHAQFETCIVRVESVGLIKQLSFGNLVLLQPELLDAYASALVNIVKDEPDGLGCITEERVRAGDFYMPEDERLNDKEQEKLLLIAMTEDLLRREIVLREEPFLVFPSQSTREYTDLTDPKGKEVIFEFEGPILNIYATLAVRLSYSDFFKKENIWKNAITYSTSLGGSCGIILRNKSEGRGELTLFFDEMTSEQTRFHFEEYVQAHLQRRALPSSIRRRRLFLCNTCGAIITEQIVRLRFERGFDWLKCSVCDTRISLLDREKLLVPITSSRIFEMNRNADQRRDRETAKSIIQGKRESNDFDVFLCHNRKNKSKVKEIAEKLKDYGILPWLDEWELRPGLPWQRLLEKQITQIKSVAVFVGKNGIGPWEQMEIEAFLRQFVRRDSPVIPVLLADASKEPPLPTFLEGMTWVDFRKQDPDPLKQLAWGITGKRM